MLPIIDPQDSPVHVLVVDDDARLLHAIQASLRKAGYQCTSFNNVDEAAAYFSVAHIDLIVTDLSMPGIDGAGFIGLIRNISRVPIIVATGNVTKGRALAQQYCQISAIRKPFASDELLACVVAALEANRQAASR
jgi:DNA-binding response OmpR family regulator